MTERGRSTLIQDVATQVEETRGLLRGAVVETPVLQSRGALADGEELYFKCENFQKGGSFKLRGAVSKLKRLPRKAEVVTASSGNHGIACCLAAQITRHRLTVVLPTNVAEAKRETIAGLGARIVLEGADSGISEVHARSLAEETGAEYVSPYNDPAIVAGQGTIGLELLDQLGAFDRVYISMGGGGLSGGIGAVLKTHAPATQIVGVSAVNSGALARSLEAGRVVDIAHEATLADGCAGGMDHDALTLPIVVEVMDAVVECSEDQIAEALRDLAWTEKMLVEGAAAMAYAGFKAMHASHPVGRSVVVLCGSNFDRGTVERIVTS
ncbi:MAG: pyridoxal-phosphate dependent enzyme [Pseudomonadota bacterium]